MKKILSATIFSIAFFGLVNSSHAGFALKDLSKKASEKTSEASPVSSNIPGGKTFKELKAMVDNFHEQEITPHIFGKSAQTGGEEYNLEKVQSLFESKFGVKATKGKRTDGEMGFEIVYKATDRSDICVQATYYNRRNGTQVAGLITTPNCDTAVSKGLTPEFPK